MNHWHQIVEMLCDLYNLNIKKLTEEGVAEEYQPCLLKRSSLDVLL